MLAGALLAASLALTPAQSDKIDAAVDQVMQAYHIPGLSLGIARKGEVLLLRGYGERDRGHDAAPDGDTVYRVGSITKQFTAALVLKQIERGTLELDTIAHGVTVEQLLSQTSGIPNFTDSGQTIEAALASAPIFQPGSEWQYSNTNYYLLGTLLESSTNETYDALLQTQILTPLGLAATSLNAPSGADAAVGYDWNDGGYIAVDSDFEGFAEYGLSSTARDLLTWLEALRSGRVVSADDFSAMVTSQSLPSGKRTHYGYGWYVRDWYGWKTAEHPGYVQGYSADDAIVVDDGLEIAVLANVSDAYLLPISKTIVSLLETPRDVTEIADFEHPAQNENPSVTHDVTNLVREIQRGEIDRSRLSATLSKTLTKAAIDQGETLLGPLGNLTLVEFIGRTAKKGVDFEKYRLSFGYKQFWMTLSYAKSGKIDTLSIEPDEE
jgi:D-alanyl-D-alanine carboxypeptidase